MKKRLDYLWKRVLVFLGLRVWAREVYCRPKGNQWCAYCEAYTCKRVKKTRVGAIYQCKKCGRMFHLMGGASKLVPVRG